VSHYIHQTPGRVRVRSNAFRCRAGQTRVAEQQLKALPGVYGVRINPHAGSITVQFDCTQTNPETVLNALESVGCFGLPRRRDEPTKSLAGMFGKALVGAIAQKAVERSARTLVGALI
jgi:copper chaperone CopZ